jgi:hypothetical protein
MSRCQGEGKLESRRRKYLGGDLIRFLVMCEFVFLLFLPI